MTRSKRLYRVTLWSGHVLYCSAWSRRTAIQATQHPDDMVLAVEPPSHWVGDDHCNETVVHDVAGQVLGYVKPEAPDCWSWRLRDGATSGYVGSQDAAIEACIQAFMERAMKRAARTNHRTTMVEELKALHTALVV